MERNARKKGPEEGGEVRQEERRRERRGERREKKREERRGVISQLGSVPIFRGQRSTARMLRKIVQRRNQ